MGHDVFISYSNSDKPIADAVCARIEAAGIRCWIAPRDVVPGEDWAAALDSAISRAKIMVVIISVHANASKHVKREVELAVAHEDIVVPVRIEDVQPSGSLQYFLGSTHWLDAITPPIEAHLDSLVTTILRLLDVSQPPRSQPPLPPPAPSGSNKLLVGGVTLAILGVLALAVAVTRPEISAEPDVPSIPATTAVTAGVVRATRLVTSELPTALPTSTLASTEPPSVITAIPTLSPQPAPIDLHGLCSAYPFDPSSPEILFEPGASSGVFSGALDDDSFRQFRLKAAIGQTMTISIDSQFLVCVGTPGSPLVGAGIGGGSTVIATFEEYFVTVATFDEGGPYQMQLVIPPLSPAE